MRIHQLFEKRRRLIVDKQFQHNFVLVAVLVAILLCNLLLIYGFLFYEPLLYARLTFTQAAGIAGVELIVIALAAAYGLTTSKKVAGPMQGILRVLRALDAGDFSARIAIRDGEYFNEVTRLINVSLDRLEGRVIDLKETANAVIPEVSSPELDSDHLISLRRQLDALTTRLDRQSQQSDEMFEREPARKDFESTRTSEIV